MTAVVGVALGFVRFVYRFLVGDDLLLAAVMLLGLAATASLVTAAVNAWWLVPGLAILMTAVSLRRGLGGLRQRV